MNQASAVVPPRSCERLFNSSVGHYVRSCTYYKSAREHARPVVSIRIFDSSEQCVVRRRRSSRVESLSVPSVSPVVSPGRFRPDEPTPLPRRLTDEPPARAGANTMRGRARRRSPVPRLLPFCPASMTPSARRGFGDETPSLSAVFKNQKKPNRLITRLRWRPPRWPGWRSCPAAADSARSACPARGTPSVA